MTHIPKVHVESKYVSVFADAKPDVDITFRDDLLAAPADNYMVGIDHLMINMGSFSMVPVFSNPIILEVLRLHVDAVAEVSAFPSGFRVTKDDGTAADEPKLRSYRIGSTDGIYTFGQFLTDLGQLAYNVNSDMSLNTQQPRSTQVGDTGSGFVVNIAGATVKQHLSFEIGRGGRLHIHGSKGFWSNYMIHVPEEYFRQVFFGASQELTIMNPTTGLQVQTTDANEVVEVLSATHRKTVHNQLGDFTYHADNAAGAENIVTFKCKACLFSTLDRRISIDVGTSLPIKGSPLIDKERDSHDFILARYMFKRPGFRFRGQTSTASYTSGRDVVQFEEDPPGLHVYEDTKTQYHQLQPQQKISQLRIKLFARVRQYTDGEGLQQVIEVPTQDTDYWFARIHFIGKG